MKKVLSKVLGDPQDAVIKRYKKTVQKINDLETQISKLKDEELAKKTDEFKKRLKKGEKLDAILPEAFAVVRETAKRTLGQRHFDVQLIGGMALNDGNVAEMKTGEGKTLVATAPVYLNALEGEGVHVVTVNDYLAQRDAGWMAEVYHRLGLSTGVIIADESFLYNPEFNNDKHEDKRFHHLMPVSRKEAYAADITYGTNNEFGFDYLRDNMVSDAEQLRQRKLHYAIVDEVDSILIDEARTPLIISAPASESESGYRLFADIMKDLNSDDYDLDEKRRSVVLTQAGIEKIEKTLNLSNLYDPNNVRLIYHLEQSLKAETLFKRDRDYVVSKDGEVIIVDEFTGRLMQGRRYNEGLHQAIEAKEGVNVLEESMTLATISFQNYFRLYKKLSGMTGTAKTEEEEFNQIYDIEVIVIPTNKDLARQDLPDKIFANEAGKFKALIEDVREHHKEGRAVLIGTVSIQKNELLSSLLTEAKVPHQVLNAKNNETEASIVAKAGQPGAVTLATNIAGRGTDIVLDEKVKEKGGLVVIGSERHEARRIDNQLRGRSGRQGDPGITQFYVSTEDDLMRIFGGERLAGLMNRLGVEEDTAITHRSVSKSLESAQGKVEGFNFDTRKNVVQYDDVMNRHRKFTYTNRRKALDGEDISGRILNLIDAEAKALAGSIKDGAKPKDVIDEAAELFGFNKTEKDAFAQIIKDYSKKDRLPRTGSKKQSKMLIKLSDELSKIATKSYLDKKESFGDEKLQALQRDVYLQALDVLWMEHLENMHHLREGIGWRSIGQRDPLVEYRFEGQKIFDKMQIELRRQVLRAIFHASLSDVDTAVETELTKAAKASVDNADDITTGVATSSEDFEGPIKVKLSSDSGGQAHLASSNKAKKAKSKARKKQRQNRKKR
jgi:preprotein translocase subunit SecA